MGEKIRDIREINILGMPLMVELNEGYNKKEGRVIHIQNSDFRYYLKEREFLHLAAAIIRANEELEILKGGKYGTK